MKFIRFARGCARTFFFALADDEGRPSPPTTHYVTIKSDGIRSSYCRSKLVFFDVDVVKLCYTTRAFVHKAEQHNMQGDILPTENSAALGDYMTQSEELQSIGLCRAPCIKRQLDFDRKKRWL